MNISEYFAIQCLKCESGRVEVIVFSSGCNDEDCCGGVSYETVVRCLECLFEVEVKEEFDKDIY